MVGAIDVLEELDQYIVLLIADALGQGIHKGILAQVACLRGNAGEGGDDLVVDHIAAGSGRGMGIAVSNIRGAAVILSGIDSGFTQGFLQTGNTGQILGIQRYIVQPGIAAVFGIRAVDSRHGQRDQEGIGRIDHRFRNTGLNEQVQAEGQIICGGVAVSIGFRQGSAAAGVDILFQRVLDSGGIVRESSLKTGDQLVRLIVIHRLAAGSLIRGLVSILSRQTENGEEDVAILRRGDPVEKFRIGGAVFGLGVGVDVGNLQISELDARHGVTVGGAVGVEGRYPAGIAEDGFNTVFVLDTGADIGGIPDAVLLSRGEVILEEAQTAGFGGVDRGLGNRCCRGGDGNGAENGEGHDECEGFF